jgi:hypothetical protein
LHLACILKTFATTHSLEDVQHRADQHPLLKTSFPVPNSKTTNQVTPIAGFDQKMSIAILLH